MKSLPRLSNTHTGSKSFQLVVQNVYNWVHPYKAVVSIHQIDALVKCSAGSCEFEVVWPNVSGKAQNSQKGLRISSNSKRHTKRHVIELDF